MTDTGKAMGREATVKVADLTLDEALAIAAAFERHGWRDGSWVAAYQRARALIDDSAGDAVARLSRAQEPQP